MAIKTPLSIPAHVLNVASLAGVVAQPNMSAYTASKHAVMGLCDALTLELDNTPIIISTVCPGVIDADITRSVTSLGGDANFLVRAHGIDPNAVPIFGRQSTRTAASLLKET